MVYNHFKLSKDVNRKVRYSIQMEQLQEAHLAKIKTF